MENIKNFFNNDNLPFQQKIVCCIPPKEYDNTEKLVELIKDAFEAIYGIVILLFPDVHIAVVTNDIVSQKTIHTEVKLIDEENILEKLTIVPFPKL